MVLHDMLAPPKSHHFHHCSPFPGYPWRAVMKGNPPNGQHFQKCISLFCLEKRNGQNYKSMFLVFVHELWPMIWLDGQGCGINMIRKFMTRKVRNEIWMDKDCKYICVPMLIKRWQKDFDDALDTKTCSVVTNQPVSPANLVIAQRGPWTKWLWWAEVMCGHNDMDPTH